VGEALRLILEKIKDWWPVRIIDAGCQGIWWRANGTAETLKPGWHFFIPQAQRIQEVNVQYQNVDCGLQSLTTKDGQEVALSLNVGYRISDSALLFTTFQHFDTTLINLARGHAAEIVAETTKAEIQEDPVSFGNEIVEALQEDLEACGVEIEDVTADQFSRARTLRLLQTSSY
jgi:regulator of protease activity HflC (stomatin/prohibitin superfamily)